MRGLLIVGALLRCASASAQGNDLGSPTGARATLMGNTGVALGRDGSAPFNNPATIVTIRDQRLAFAVNFYSLGFTNYSHWHRPGDVDSEQFGDHPRSGTKLFDTAFRSLPSTLCLFFTLEDLASSIAGKKDAKGADKDPSAPEGKKLAICFATVESEDVDQQAITFRADTAAGPSTHVQSLQRRWVRLYIGPTYSISLSERLAIGASVHVVYSYDSFGMNSDSLSARVGGGGIASRLSASGSGKSFELTGVIGATYRVDRWTLGASIRPPSLHVLGDLDSTFTQSSTGSSRDSSVVADASGSLRSAPLTRVALGAGYAWERLTLEADLSLGIPLQNTLTAELTVGTSTFDGTNVTRTQQRQTYAIPSRFTANPAVGFEYLVTPSLGLLGGLSTNFSSLADLTKQESVGNMVQARTHNIMAALGVGSYWKDGELLFGIQFDYGWGQALAANPYIIPNDWNVIAVQSYTILFVISGSTSLSSIVRMVSTIANGGDDSGDKSFKGAPKPSEKKLP
jgi:hypothetical protein